MWAAALREASARAAATSLRALTGFSSASTAWSAMVRRRATA